MKIKVIITIALIVVCSIYACRVSYINRNTLNANLQVYNIRDEVSIDNDYFDTSSEKMQGYSIKIIETDLLSNEEFKDKYPNYNEQLPTDYMYIIKACFKNNNNTSSNLSGIDLGQYILQNNSYINFIDQQAFELLNDFDTIKFSLRNNSEKEIYIPFHIDLLYINIDKLMLGNTQLVVSLYPNKKVIKLC